MTMMRRSPAVSLYVLAAFIAVAVITFIQPACLTKGTAGVRNGSVIQLGAKDDFQRALDEAKPGDTIVLQAGATYEGPFTLPVKSGNEFITIQTSRVNELPEGTRVSPSQSALFAKLQSSENGSPIVQTAARAHHYKFIGIEFSTTKAQVVVRDLVRLGAGDQPSLDSVPHHLVIDRSYIHGFPTQDVQRGIALNSAETSITNSYISDVHGKGFETQAICGWNGPGPFKIINNYVEGAGINIMFGGADPSIKNLTPTDIEIRENHFFKPLSWKPGDPTFAGIHWAVKNLFELKNARRVKIDRNIFENNWVDAQAGRAIIFSPRNDNGTAPWSTIEDVAFTNNIVMNTPTAVNILGTDDIHPSDRVKRLTISNNLFINIGDTFMVMSGSVNVTISNNTHIQSGNIMTLHGEPSTGFTYENNITVRGSKGYGVMGDATGEGTIALRKFTPNGTFRKNVVVGANPSQYPADNYYPASVNEVAFMGFDTGDFRLNPRSRYKQASEGGTSLGVDFSLLPTLSR